MSLAPTLSQGGQPIIPSTEYTVIQLIDRFIWEEEGQSTVEYMLLISVIVIAIVAAAYVFIPTFKSGVQALTEDVSSILDEGKIDGVGDRTAGGVGGGGGGGGGGGS